MINRLKKLYKGYLILVRKNNKIYDLDNNVLPRILINKNYLIINSKYSYEVHKKTKL